MANVKFTKMSKEHAWRCRIAFCKAPKIIIIWLCVCILADKVVRRGYFGTGMFPCMCYSGVMFTLFSHQPKSNQPSLKNTVESVKTTCSILLYGSLWQSPIAILSIVECWGDFFSNSMYKNLSSLALRLTLDRIFLCSFILLCISPYRSKDAIGHNQS